MANEDDLDAILESALEDFVDTEQLQNESAAISNSNSASLNESIKAEIKKENNNNNNVKSNDNKSSTDDDAKEEELQKELENEMKKLFGDFDLNGDLPSMMETLTKAMQNEANNNNNNDNESGDNKSTNKDPFAATLESLAETAKKLENTDETQIPELNEEMIKGLLTDMEQDSEFQEMLNSMMGELMSKEVLHSPMLSLKEKLPAWLKENKETLSEEEVTLHTTQIKYVMEICAMFDTGEANNEKVMKLMNEMHELGPLPTAVMNEVVPEGESMEQMENLQKMMQDGVTPDKCSIM